MKLTVSFQRHLRNKAKACTQLTASLMALQATQITKPSQFPDVSLTLTHDFPTHSRYKLTALPNIYFILFFTLFLIN